FLVSFAIIFSGFFILFLLFCLYVSSFFCLGINFLTNNKLFKKNYNNNINYRLQNQTVKLYKKQFKKKN
ncbi:hypothetical protein ABI011_14965, partial [Enterococcus faecium]|uniref:hypothetical protein n=1 Tax=Enterococcus faecium TaxID=1352 RepID=UPI003F425518